MLRLNSICALVLGALISVPSGPSAQEAAARPEGRQFQLPAGSLALGHRETALGTYALPIGPFSTSGIPMRLAEGHILRRTWQLRGDSTVLQVLDPLRQQLVEQGYEILFQCAARQCGGFDFRFGIEVVPAPDMMVSLSDYHFLALSRPTQNEAQQSVASLLVSRSGTASYVQLIEVTPSDQTPLELTATDLPPATPVTPLATELLQQGRAVLQGVVFNTGDAALGQAAISSLEELSAFLAAEPQARVLIVGHTDTIGSLSDNIALSQRRAESVRENLVSQHGIDAARVEVAGAGYMAPIASNLTAQGRESNRRVEAVLISK